MTTPDPARMPGAPVPPPAATPADPTSGSTVEAAVPPPGSTGPAPGAAGPTAYGVPSPAGSAGPAGAADRAAGSTASGAPPPPGPTTPPHAPPYGAPPYGAPRPGATPPAAPPSYPGATWPDRRDPGQPGLVFGVILVVVGALFLALRLGNITLGPESWPLWLIVPGLAMLGGSLFIPSRGGLGLAIPGVILAIVGGIVWVQAAYNLYATWSYAWALVAPTGPGLAMLLYGAVHRDGDLARDGVRATLTGLGLFLGFGLFFEGVIGISGHRIERLDQVLPYAAIGLGILLIVVAFLDGGHRDQWRDQRRAQRHAEKEQRRAKRRAEKADRRAAR